MKRLFDILISLTLLPPAIVLILVCAVAIRLSSPGPAIFRQLRVGMHEKPFTCLKL
jgi:O-antigen biosynthesis protein WbqP